MDTRKCAYCGGYDHSGMVVCQHCGGSEWITYNEYRQSDDLESKKSSGTNEKSWYDYITLQMVEGIALSIIGFLAGRLLNKKPTGSSSPQSNGSKVSPSPNVVIYNVIPDKAGSKKKSGRLKRKQRDAIQSRFVSTWIASFLIFSPFSILVFIAGSVIGLDYGLPIYISIFISMGIGVVCEIAICLVATWIASEVGPYEDYGPF